MKSVFDAEKKYLENNDQYIQNFHQMKKVVDDAVDAAKDALHAVQRSLDFMKSKRHHDGRTAWGCSSAPPASAAPAPAASEDEPAPPASAAPAPAAASSDEKWHKVGHGGRPVRSHRKPVTDVKFEWIDNNVVKMSWTNQPSHIRGTRTLCVDSDGDVFAAQCIIDGKKMWVKLANTSAWTPRLANFIALNHKRVIKDGETVNGVTPGCLRSLFFASNLYAKHKSE
jgi:hypothetical protein